MVAILGVSSLVACNEQEIETAYGPIPTDIRVCFKKLPGSATLKTKEDFVRFIHKLREQEAKHIGCGTRLIAWVDTHDAVLKK